MLFQLYSIILLVVHSNKDLKSFQPKAIEEIIFWLLSWAPAVDGPFPVVAEASQHTSFLPLLECPSLDPVLHVLKTLLPILLSLKRHTLIRPYMSWHSSLSYKLP